MKRLLVYLKGYEKESIIAPLFKMLEAFFDLMVPLVVASIINNGISQNNMTVVWQNFGLLLVLMIIGLACSVTAQYFASKASVGFGTKLRQALFDHIQSLSYTELDRLGTNTLITRLTSDINQVQTGYNLTLRLLLRSPFIVLGAMIMAFTIDVESAWIFAIAIPILSVVVFGIMLISIPLYKKVQKRLDAVLTATRENLTGVRVIRAFRKEEDEIKSFDEKNVSLTKTNSFVGRLSALMNPATYLIVNMATILLIQKGAIRVEMGALDRGSVVALYNYMAQIIVELIKLADLIITIDKSLACAGRIGSVLDVKSSMQYGNRQEKDTDVSVLFDHVYFTYSGASAESLSDISFEAKKGQTVGIIGGTGSGKSSLVNLIARFYDASQGTVFVNGLDVKEYPEGKLLDKIGIVPQKAILFKGSVRDNLKWGKEDASDEEIWKALEIAQAKEVVEGKQGQLDFTIEQNGRNLSGGQRQRLTIARALVSNPEILIMDDSASALDFATDAALRKAINSLQQKMTVFIVSQRTASVLSADLILVLDDGQLVGKGSHDMLMETCPIYQEIYYSQFPEKRKEAVQNV
ncbi:MAG: ABC transporter ATP-binding protein [Faecalicoccus sp.]|nr:ABC transporter ATP-binding protein [Faecalicoccus sp.]